MVIDWARPIEWDDGTDAELIEDLGSSKIIKSSQEPRGWDSARLPSLGRNKTVMVSADGTTSIGTGPRLRNVDLPMFEFGDGTVPTKVSLTAGGSWLTVTHEKGITYQYTWPTLRPRLPNYPRFRRLNKVEAEVKERVEVQRAEIEARDDWGMF